jgi:methionine-rich copper-binding protein CopC
MSASFKQLIIGRSTMKILSLLTGVALVTFGVTANAHAHLQKSSPADNSVITTSPSNLVLNFSEAARLTALSIQKDEEPKQNLKPLPTTAAQQISVPLPPLTPGSYSVSWRVLSDDGHVMSGTLHFTLASDHTTDHPTGRSAQH